MADRPILFSAPMVQALLAGRKTQTRRKYAPGDHVLIQPVSPRFSKGDRLWVRETFSGDHVETGKPPRDWDEHGAVWYWAAGNPEEGDWTRPKPGIHMPRWASRLTLGVTDVRVQRLFEISHTDAMAEGLEWVAPTWGITGISDSWQDDPRMAYRALWDAINGSGAANANPWIVAVTFTVERRNIDA